MRISDWSSDVCSSDLQGSAALIDGKEVVILPQASAYQLYGTPMAYFVNALKDGQLTFVATGDNGEIWQADFREDKLIFKSRSEEHTSELQSLMRISYAVFCLKNNNKHLTYTEYVQLN